MAYIIGLLTILFESACLLSLILTMGSIVFCEYESFPNELKSISNLRCAKCDCVYIPTPNREPSPSPKYCPECGRKMINWKEIKI